jgi:predicted RNase H-like HicB family nuclease
MNDTQELLKKPYARLIVPDSGVYVAQVAEFPGCFAEGKTPDEAYANLEVAAESWIESAYAQGFPVPEPFASQEYSGTVSLRLPKSLHRRASEYAHRDGVSLNQTLVTAIASWVGSEDAFARSVARIDGKINQLVRLQTARTIFSGVSIRRDEAYASKDFVRLDEMSFGLAPYASEQHSAWTRA